MSVYYFKLVLTSIFSTEKNIRSCFSAGNIQKQNVFIHMWPQSMLFSAAFLFLKNPRKIPKKLLSYPPPLSHGIRLIIQWCPDPHGCKNQDPNQTIHRLCRSGCVFGSRSFTIFNCLATQCRKVYFIVPCGSDFITFFYFATKQKKGLLDSRKFDRET